MCCGIVSNAMFVLYFCGWFVLIGMSGGFSWNVNTATDGIIISSFDIEVVDRFFFSGLFSVLTLIEHTII